MCQSLAQHGARGLALHTHMMVWGFCSTQAFGPNVVTGHGPCRERVLLWEKGSVSPG